LTQTRRLAAILAADVAGYSRLMGADEEGTLERLKALRRELGDPKVKEYRGRVVKTTGDGLLIEFSSVVDAVRCAVEVQQAMVERNAEVPELRRIEFRMGINLGDIIRDGRDIYGDGVNVAARLKRSPNRAGFASAGWCATRCETSSMSRSRTWASSRSRTSQDPCMSGASGPARNPPRYPRRYHCPISRRSQCCPLRI
jgi:hypothetical protein